MILYGLLVHQKYEQSTELSKHIWMLKKGRTDRARFQAAILQSPDLFSTPEIRTKYRAVKAYLDVEERKD